MRPPPNPYPTKVGCVHWVTRATAGRGAYRNARGVVLRSFAKPVPVRHVGALWRKTTAREAAIAALCTLVSEHTL